MNCFGKMQSYKREVEASCLDCSWTSVDFCAEREAIEHSYKEKHKVVVTEKETTTYRGKKERRIQNGGRRRGERG